MAGVCQNIAALLSHAKEADTVILSPRLQGITEAEIVDALKDLRDRGFRVVLLPGDPGNPEARDLAAGVVEAGIYDLIWNPVSPSDVVERLLNPATPEEAAGFIASLRPPLSSARPARETGKDSGETVNNTADDTVGNFLEHVKLPEDFFIYGGKTPDEIAAANQTAVILPADRPDLIDTIKSLRRDFRLAAVPVVVLGECDTVCCYQAGADECVDVLDDQSIERIRARAKKMREMWEQAEKDPLTGLYNRRFLEKYLVEQERRYRETGVPFSLLMCDLDHFKRINDTYGHDAGDAVLKEFAAFLAGGVRHVDLVARYGGEEFIIIFPGLDDARGIAERLCRGWAGHVIRLPDSQVIQSTFSGGLAVMGRDAEDIGGLIRAADGALYWAKGAGRNRVVAVGDLVDKQHEAMAERKAPVKERLQSQIASRRILPSFKSKSVEFEKKIRAPADLEYAIDEIKRHNVIVVWNLDSRGKVESAIEIAVSLKKLKRKVLLVEMDFLNPAMDRIAGIPVVKKKDIPGKTVMEIGAGLLTLGSCLEPEHAAGLIRQKCGSFKVDYLAAGNDLGVVEYAGEQVYCDMIILLARRYDQVVIDLGVGMDGPTFNAAVKCADILVIPVSNDIAASARYEKIMSVKNVVFVKRR
ncbi:diguanylate cyclase [Desulfofundulus thermobenzoicus]|uniref:diguanylate cyclase n=1 Tax=Desulfofundulus thermobenzoicus TaxID=29376 RepID=UPI00128F127D|nr:diguanylate cyclase [Desulfofundulus thermobenzoicus]